jgi:hypothetical protein
MLANYFQLFGNSPKEYSSPMEEGDHPELDLTQELDQDGIRLYQSLIGALQWAVTLGRFDILVGVTTMSSFRVAPRQGHVERLQRMYGYLKRQPDGAIRFRTGIPDHESRGPPVTYSWINSVYGPNNEELPDNMPTPRGKPMRTTTYEDANLMHCLVTGRSMSGAIHLVNQTPVQWFCKKQNVLETATYGSEFMVARQATEQIMDLRYTLRMMGIPIDGPAWMFGDNQSVITSSNIPHSNLNKRHNALSYHRVREAISANILYFIHVDGKLNPSDILTKFLSWSKFWPLIQPMLFWKGETLKDVPPTLPITQIIAMIKEGPHSGLRGVTSTSQVSPSDVINVVKPIEVNTLTRTANLEAIAPVVKKLEQKEVLARVSKWESPIKLIHEGFNPSHEGISPTYPGSKVYIRNPGKKSYVKNKNISQPVKSKVLPRVTTNPNSKSSKMVLNTESESLNTKGVDFYTNPVESYEDGTWQIVKYRKSHH